MKSFSLSSRLFAAAALVTLCPCPGRAQAPSRPSVVGNGVAEISRQPELLRMQVDLLAKAGDLQEALARLRDRRAAAEKQLAELGALPDSIKFGPPRISSAQNQQQRQLEMMVMQRLRQQGRGKRGRDEPSVAPPVTVAMSLTAEWPLEAADAEQLLVTSHELQESIKAADLAGMKEAQELTPEEEELAEEMESMMSEYNYGGESGAKPGEPSFLFVSKISEADRERILSEAFQNAQVEAARLAKAAAAELGDLAHVTSGEQGVNADDYSVYQAYYDSPAYQLLQQAQAGAGANRGEALGVAAGPVNYKVTVTVWFSLK